MTCFSFSAPTGSSARSRQLLALLLSTAAAWLALACSSLPDARPHPSHPPQDVVRFQVEALSHDDAGKGIEVAFRFASPANKQMTGPIERFARIVRAPDYAPMLAQSNAEYGSVLVADGLARQIVTITALDGSRYVYRFDLSRQAGGVHAGCWMTDSVVLVGANPVDAFAI